MRRDASGPIGWAGVPSIIRLYPSASSSTPVVLVVTLREGSTTSVPPPPPQPSQASGAAHCNSIDKRERKGEAEDITRPSKRAVVPGWGHPARWNQPERRSRFKPGRLGSWVT
jgi:hypothetical protein